MFAHAVSCDAHWMSHVAVLSTHVAPFAHCPAAHVSFTSHAAPVNPRAHAAAVLVVVVVDVDVGFVVLLVDVLVDVVVVVVVVDVDVGFVVVLVDVLVDEVVVVVVVEVDVGFVVVLVDVGVLVVVVVVVDVDVGLLVDVDVAPVWQNCPLNPPPHVQLNPKARSWLNGQLSATHVAASLYSTIPGAVDSDVAHSVRHV